jgi:hypothetical protein
VLLSIKPNPTSSEHQIANHGTTMTDSATDRRRTASDKATLLLIRRVLAPNALSSSPLEELPALTSSPELNFELYALIAIIFREYVLSWYDQITPDRAFVDEVLAIIAHCTRGLEARAKDVDWEALLLDEIPGIVEAHLVGKFLLHEREL